MTPSVSGGIVDSSVDENSRSRVDNEKSALRTGRSGKSSPGTERTRLPDGLRPQGSHLWEGPALFACGEFTRPTGRGKPRMQEVYCIGDSWR